MRLVFFILFIFIGDLLMGCAGPMDPFGSIDSLQRNPAGRPSESQIFPQRETNNSRAIQAKFSPRRQLLHNKSQWKINLTDPAGIPPDYQLYIWYNGRDVTERYLKRAKIIQDNPIHIQLRLKHLRLLPHKDNIIHVGYQRKNQSPIIVFEYEGPDCPLSKFFSIKNRGPFHQKGQTFHLIDHISRTKGLNPAFLAGLVAQESGFNPKAVSSSRAIGLTQITPLAQAQLKHVNNSWPHYPDMKKLSTTKIKTLIGLGIINQSNEWRLDQEKSLTGGVEYLSFLNSYWKGFGNKDIWEKADIYFEDIILASYNSGPYRVKREIISKGPEWIKSPHLKEARKYIGKVKSYCYHFTQPSQ